MNTANAVVDGPHVDSIPEQRLHSKLILAILGDLREGSNLFRERLGLPGGPSLPRSASYGWWWRLQPVFSDLSVQARGALPAIGLAHTDVWTRLACCT